MPDPSIPHTRDALLHDMRALGIQAGDTLFVHSSFRSLGPVAGGAQSVVEALEAAVGPEGLLLMPSFNLVTDRLGTWNIASTPSTVGYLTEFFRTMPTTLRSDHFSHSVAARGRDAAWITADHLSTRGMCSPWDGLEAGYGRCYGSDSPMIRAWDRGGRVLMLGVSYHSSTYAHVVETIYWNQTLADDPDAVYPKAYREVLGAYWDQQGRLHRGMIGSAPCRLFAIDDFLNTLVAAITAEPERFLKNWCPEQQRCVTLAR